MLASRIRAGLVALALLVGAVLATPASAAAQDPVQECLSGQGIYVFVFDAEVELVSGCTEGGTGLERLAELTTVQTVGQGFVCRVAEHPEDCDPRPASDQAYWSYWWWRDGRWLYATVGAAYPGVPGSVEAWHYSAGQPPPLSPSTGDQSAASTPQPGGSGSATPEPPADEADPERPWLPTAVTAGALAIAALGYGLWRHGKGEQ